MRQRSFRRYRPQPELMIVSLCNRFLLIVVSEVRKEQYEYPLVKKINRACASAVRGLHYERKQN